VPEQSPNVSQNAFESAEDQSTFQLLPLQGCVKKSRRSAQFKSGRGRKWRMPTERSTNPHGQTSLKIYGGSLGTDFRKLVLIFL
jgi:hypothetical protein